MSSEELRRALRLHGLETVRRERWLIEQRDAPWLCRWFVGLHGADPVWAPASITKHRERWLVGDVAQALGEPVLGQARARQPLSDAPVSVDGTLRAPWSGRKGFKRTGPPPRTAPELRLFIQAKGPEAKRCDLG